MTSYQEGTVRDDPFASLLGSGRGFRGLAERPQALPARPREELTLADTALALDNDLNAMGTGDVAAFTRDADRAVDDAAARLGLCAQLLEADENDGAMRTYRLSERVSDAPVGLLFATETGGTWCFDSLVYARVAQRHRAA